MHHNYDLLTKNQKGRYVKIRNWELGIALTHRNISFLIVHCSLIYPFIMA